MGLPMQAAAQSSSTDRESAAERGRPESGTTEPAQTGTTSGWLR